MSKRKDTDYLYASSRIRALEKSLLNKERVERMLEARNIEDSVKVLHECEYGAGQELNIKHYEELLSQEHQKNLELIKLLADELSPLFHYQYDYLNVKILLKAEFLGQDESLFSPLGGIPVSKLRQSLSERTFEGMTPIMQEAAALAIEAFGKSGDPQGIDLILDVACFEDMKFKARELKSPFIFDYVTREIDSANIKAFVRIKRQGGGSDLLRRVFVDGGSIGLPMFLSHFDEELGTFAQALTYTEYGSTLEAALPVIAAGNLGAFEKMFDDFRIGQIQKAKFVPFGLEPIFAFMLAKESDIKTARIILAGKSLGLPPERIAERVRKTYA